MIKEIIETKESGNAIISIAIGEIYEKKWHKFVSENWKEYCVKNKLGLFLVTDNLIPKQNPHWKKATWQKLILGVSIEKYSKKVKNLCYIDSDFLINKNAKNVFDNYEEDKISLVSQFKHLPFDEHLIKRRISFFRNKYYSSEYPLDSAIYMTIDDLCNYHDKPKLNDYACAGFFIFNVKSHSKKMKECFCKYTSTIETVTGGGDEFHFNFEIQSNFNIKWLEYKYQALWLYEMAAYYPFLYKKENQTNKDLIKSCVITSLENNFFLHFAGSWHESNMIYIDNLINSQDQKKFDDYMTQKVTGEPKGMIKPAE
tara:strand:- start:756 stop:1694 length:939 start_codon:yes stop_codon:yes gene_type:complete